MNIILLQFQLDLSELKQLAKEFPDHLFLSFPRLGEAISSEHWKHTEVLFGEKLAPEELALASHLRWIHTPSANIHRLCLKEIEQRGNILITNTREENLFQMGEYVLAGLLAFAKNLFAWKTNGILPNLLWDCKWRNKMWTLQDKIFLQIGMGKIGLEIARRANEAGMKVWGMDRLRSFHPYCQKQLSYEDLHTALPNVDIVSLALPQEERARIKLGNEELTLMKEDSILSLLGSYKQLDAEALATLSSQGKFRGILIDTYYQTPIPLNSPLWKIPNILITPEVAPRPKKDAREAFHLFRFNLRHFLHGNYSDMKNLLDPSIAFIPEVDETIY